MARLWRGGRIGPPPPPDPLDGLTLAEQHRVYNQLVEQINELVERIRPQHVAHDRMRPGARRNSLARKVKALYRELKRVERLKRNLFPGVGGGALTLNPIENLRRLGRFVLGRSPHSPGLERLIKEHGSEQIRQIIVARQPIQGRLRSALNTLTFGGLDRVPYDTLFHLFMVVRTERTTFTCEKNEVIRITMGSGSLRPEQGGVGVPAFTGNGPTIAEFFGRGIKACGPTKFFTYDAFNRGQATNCQGWIAFCLLGPNGMLTPQLRSFILQDTKTIAKHLPSFAAPAARALTDLAARARLLVGEGPTRVPRR